MRSGAIPKTELLYPLSTESGHVTLLPRGCVHQPGSSTEPLCAAFFLEFHSGAMMKSPGQAGSDTMTGPSKDPSLIMSSTERLQGS